VGAQEREKLKPLLANGTRFSRTRSERSVSAEALVGRVAEQSAMERVGGNR